MSSNLIINDDIGSPIVKTIAPTLSSIVFCKETFVTAGNSLRWYNIKTGQLIAKVDLEATSFCQRHQDIWIGVDQKLLAFNQQGQQVQEWNLGLGQVLHVKPNNQDDDRLWVVVVKQRQGEQGEKFSSVVYSVNTKSKNVTKVFKLDRRCALFDVDRLGTTLACVPQHTRHPIPSEKLIFFSKTQTKHVHDQPISCLAFSPTENVLATGDLQGKITLWYYKSEPVTTSTLHWHANRVASIAFGPDGTRLYSGGLESVLVTWNLSTREKTFFPRMGSEIVSLGVGRDEGHVVLGVAHADNSVRIVSGVQNTKIQGVKSVHSMAGIALDPRGNLCLWGDKTRPVIQFYNPSTEKSLGTLDLSPRNKVSKTVKVKITHVDLDKNWMVTMDVGLGRSLRFWKWDAEAYQLHTLVPEPPEINGVALKDPICITTGQEMCLWKRVDSWTMTYKFKTASSHPKFSPDGSILATVTKAGIVLWNPETMERLTTLTLAQESVVDLGFCGSRLVVATKKGLYVWDLTSCLRVYQDSESVSALACHGTQCAIVTQGEMVKVLDTITFKTIWESPVQKASRVAVKPGQISCLTLEGELVTFSTEEKKKHKTVSNVTKLGLNGIYGPVQPMDQGVDNVVPTIQTKTNLLDVPAHIMPPLIKLFDALMVKPNDVEPMIVDDEQQESNLDASSQTTTSAPHHVTNSSLPSENLNFTFLAPIFQKTKK